ncbi:hypothetical protein GCM10027442_41680 [Emticicia fontis]
MLCTFIVKAQNTPDFQIIDISQKEILIFNQSKSLDSTNRAKLLVDSLFTPYKKFWNGYLGDEKGFVEWVHESVYPNLVGYNQRNNQINGEKLLQQFNEVKQQMYQLTGYKPKGIWYIVFGPAWTDLGGFSDGTMLIDLSHGSNTSNERIMKMFPHEINHQIHSNMNTTSENTVTARVISEGFAVYMNGVYWKDKFSDAENLGYSEPQLEACKKQMDYIKSIFKKSYNSTDKATIDNFANRSYFFTKELPGALGYFIGLEIVKNYVALHGKDSWKNIYKLSPQQVYEQSGF